MRTNTSLYLSVTPQMERDVLLGEGEDMDTSGEGTSSDEIREREMAERDRDRSEPPRKCEHLVMMKVLLCTKV